MFLVGGTKWWVLRCGRRTERTDSQGQRVSDYQVTDVFLELALRLWRGGPRGGWSLMVRRKEELAVDAQWSLLGRRWA